VNRESLDPERLLHGEYEYTDFSSRDLRYRRVPDYSYSRLNKAQKLYTPFLDRKHAGADPEWPGDAEFAVCLTHDMDHVSKYAPRQSFRNGLLRAKTRWRGGSEDGYLSETGALSAAKSVAGAVIDAVSDAATAGPDPYHRYEEWLELEARYDATSTFFVLPEETGRTHVSNPEYRYGDEVVFDGERCTVADMVSRIHDRGWEVGLHPTWYSYDDAELLRHQKAELEAVIDDEVKSVRQHYLHYDPRKTPRAHHEAGFEYDSTLGFNKNVGFRRGNSYPWMLRDIERDEDLDVVEIPLIVQDVALFRDRGLALDPEKAVEYVLFLAEMVADTGGVLTLLWHPSSIAKGERFEVYETVLERLSEMGAWFGSVRDVGRQWETDDVTLSV
jgi:peptidoglycan/xylan/chitin deacetylase (PgdA/CDA1 family)